MIFYLIIWDKCLKVVLHILKGIDFIIQKVSKRKKIYLRKFVKMKMSIDDYRPTIDVQTMHFAPQTAKNRSHHATIGKNCV